MLLLSRYDKGPWFCARKPLVVHCTVLCLSLVLPSSEAADVEKVRMVRATSCLDAANMVVCVIVVDVSE